MSEAEMVENLKMLGICAVIIGFFGIGIWWQVYKYQDCRMVGHSRLYCILSIGK